MKVLLAADIFPPESGGPATYVVNLANALVKDGWDVEIVTHNPKPDKSKVNCKVYSVWAKNKIIRYLSYYILLFIHSFRADVVYAMGPVNAGLPAFHISKLMRKKFVVKVVGDYAWEQGQIYHLIKEDVNDFQNKEYNGKVGKFKKVERKVVCVADLVITPSDYLRKMVIGWGANEKKIKKIFNAVQLPSNVNPIEKPEGERWIVNVGRLVPWKGVEGVMRAIKELPESFSDIKFKIIGDGPERSHLEKLKRDLGMKNVEFLGNMSHASVLSYMAAADLVTLNSSYEGLSHTLLEARLLGRRAIASRVCGNPEVLPKDCLFPLNVVNELGKIIVEVLERPAEPASADFIALFSFEKMYLETRNLLEKVVID